jgi:hypothetical protein
MLGPLKFGLQPATVKAAAAPARFELKLRLEGGIFNSLSLNGPKGATAFIDWGDGTDSPITLTGTQASLIGNHSCGTIVTISGSNLITLLRFYAYNDSKITAIQGTYPTALKEITLGFSSENPNFTLPNVETLLFDGKPGPSFLSTGSNLTRLDFPPNLTSLDLAASTKITTLSALPAGLETLYTPPGLLVLSGAVPNLTNLVINRSTKLTTLSIPGAKITSLSLPASLTTLNVSGCTGLTSLTVPPKVTTLNISNCTALTTVAFPPALTTLRMEGSGLTTLDLSKTNVSILNMPPSMDAQLKTVLFGTKLKPSGLFRFEVPEDGAWTLY